MKSNTKKQYSKYQKLSGALKAHFVRTLTPWEQITMLLLEGRSPKSILSTRIKRSKATATKNAISALKANISKVAQSLGMQKKSVPVKSKKQPIVKTVNKKSVVVTSKKNWDKEQNHVEKNMVRKLIVLTQLLASKVTTGVILTLSAPQCVMERMIHEQRKGFTFLSCERDEKLFGKLKANIKNNNLSFMKEPFLGEISEKIRVAKKDEYAHLLLDYCGVLPSFLKEIELALNNEIVKKDGIVWLTVCPHLGKGHAGYNTELELKNLIKKFEGKYKCERAPFGYKDSMQMYTIVLRRIK